MLHTINISLHVIAGTLALVAGLLALLFTGQLNRHKRFGKVFLLLLSIVVISGFMGWVFFRSNPFLLMLTLLSGYVGFSGYRAVKLKMKRTTRYELILAVTSLITGGLYLLWLKQSYLNWSPSIIYPTVFALFLVTGYDIIKYCWLFKRLKNWWLYEHIYKVISAYSAIYLRLWGQSSQLFNPTAK